jgi:predicted transcriptional regulator of viral defense system
MQKRFLNQTLMAEQTIFSFKDLLLQWGRDLTPAQLAAKINYRVKHGDLYQIRRGLYAKNTNYNHLELATKILTPAYVSFETVLNTAGITFQYYSQIFVASYQTRTITCDGQTYIFKQIKSTILTNSLGIETHNNYAIASPERAFLDIVYLNKNYHFDNLEPLNWDKVHEILPIYGNNKSMLKRVNLYYQAYKLELK